VTLIGPAPTIAALGSLSGAVEGVDEVIAALVQWLDTSDVRCLEQRVVPGTTAAERKRLAALGGVVRSLVRPRLAVSAMPERVSTWIDAAAAPPRDLAERVARALRDHGAGFLARVYEEIVRSSNRRRLGTYFTPQATVDWMLAQWSAHEAAPRSVVDVGAGVGVFTASALVTWKAAVVTAVDVNPVTLGLLAALCMAMERRPRALRMVLQDYTLWSDHAAQTAPCVTIGNPPYTRLQLLPKSARARLTAAVPGCGTRAGLSTWILASAFARLRAEDGLLLLLPRNWIEADYGAKLRALLWNAARRRVELTGLSADLFGDARVDAVALFVGAEKRDSQPFVLRRSPDEHATELRERSGAAPSFVARSPGGRSIVPVREGRAAPVLTRPLSSFGVVRRGVATGANEYFTLTDEAMGARKLRRTHVHPLVRRLRDFATDRITSGDLAALGPSAPRWLLLIEKSQVDRGIALGAYIDHGLATKIADRHLCRQRTPWYDLHCDVKIPDIVVGAMSSARFRFVENGARAAITNNLFGLTWASTTTRDQRAAVLAWLRSDDGQRAVCAACRIQAGGLRKLEPRALGSVAVPIIE